jgi:hypothetical protein
MNDQARKPRNRSNGKGNVIARKLLREMKRRAPSSLPSLAQACETIQAMPAKRMHVFGPYPAGNRWRLLIRENGRQQAVPFDTLEQAEAAKAKMLSTLDAVACRTVGEAVEEFLSVKVESGCKP